MASPMGLLGLGSTVAGMGLAIEGGQIGAQAAQVQAEAQKTQIQGSMLQTIAKAFGLQVEATQYDYQSQVARYKSAVALINANIAKQNADYELSVGEIDAEHQGMQTRAQLGAMKAQQGASGVDVNSGSSVATRESMIELGYYDQMLTRANAAKKAYGYEVESTQDTAQAGLYQYESDMNLTQKQNALTAAGMTMDAIPIQQHAMALAGQAGNLGAAASTVSAASSVASKWVQVAQLGTSAFGLPKIS